MRKILPLALAALLVAPAPARAAEPPKLEISATGDLTEGQKITVTGSGFKAGLKQIAVGLCREGYKSGPKDCDLDGGASFVNAGSDGRIPTTTLTAHAKFKEFDCMAQQCVIGVAPLPGTVPAAVEKANTAVVKVGFKGSKFTDEAAPASSAPAAAAPESDPDRVGGPSFPLWAVTAVLLAAVAAVAARNQSLRRIT